MRLGKYSIVEVSTVDGIFYAIEWKFLWRRSYISVYTPHHWWSDVNCVKEFCLTDIRTAVKILKQVQYDTFKFKPVKASELERLINE